jgi:TrmH family RNA methyltransferase
MLNKEALHFVMVRPNFLGNIGSAARVMKNFGFHNLTLVSPPRNYQDAEARKMAVGAFEILKKAKVTNSLFEAIGQAQITFSTSSCQYRKQRPLDLLEACKLISEMTSQDQNQDTPKVAFIFGDEKDGLTNDEIALCHNLVQIPTQESFPSLNLAQALAIVAYELATIDKKVPVQTTSSVESPSELPSSNYPSLQALEDTQNLIKEVLAACEFSRAHNENLVAREILSCLKRMQATERELSLVKGALFKIKHKLNSKYSEI